MPCMHMAGRACVRFLTSSRENDMDVTWIGNLATSAACGLSVQFIRQGEEKKLRGSSNYTVREQS
jgi:hypothetical protein